MAKFVVTRPTIYHAPSGLTIEEYKSHIPDAGRRRHLCFGGDFDARAVTLGMEIRDEWEPDVKDSWERNKSSVTSSLVQEFGSHNLDSKIENFIAIDSKPMSVMAYHNVMFSEVRNTFVMGYYYPALVGACALGERILNHLILDMRQHFTNTPEYKKIHKKSSFDNWDIPIDTLEAWKILLPEAASEFRLLKMLRHRSIHFNVSTYDTMREDALAAILHMRTIIDLQFGMFAIRPWFIEGTRGHTFVRKAFEQHPFVKTYFATKLAFVGPLFGLAPTDMGWQTFDVPDYGDGDWTDEEFAAQYNGRDPELVMREPPEIEPASFG